MSKINSDCIDAFGQIGPMASAERASAVADLRTRSLSETLQRARRAAEDAGVTRLAELTGLDRIGVPVFQAVRPNARSLSVSQGKGLTRMAAQISALLESVETHVAETLPAPPERLGSVEFCTWAATWGVLADRNDVPVLSGLNLLNGRADFLPWHAVSMDFTCPRPAGLRPSTIGLATGSTLSEAIASALAEVIENDLNSRWIKGDRGERAKCEIDLLSIDDRSVSDLIRKINEQGCEIKLWYTGRDSGIASFAAIISDKNQLPSFSPAFGSGCHPNRSVAATRAILECLQVRITMIAGAREDIAETIYIRPLDAVEQLRTWSLNSGVPKFPWQRVAHQACTNAAHMTDHLLGAIEKRGGRGAVVVSELATAHGLKIVRVMASDLLAGQTSGRPMRLPATPKAQTSSLREIHFFVGPSWPAAKSEGPIVVRPPVICGDLARLRQSLPLAVAIVDGCFETVRAVWHKEILDLMNLGVPVFGAASLGAIRAAELNVHGMIGMGSIYQAFRDQSVIRDDAVMVCHAPAELRHMPLTLSLVDAEFSFSNASELTQFERRSLQRISRRFNFRDRTWANIFEEYEILTGKKLPLAARISISTQGSLKYKEANQLFLFLLRNHHLITASQSDIATGTIYYKNLLDRASRDSGGAI